MPKIVDVIKYEGDNSTFIWKHPSEDFNNLTQLIVHEGQEAIFVMNGQALDLFGPGRYTLNSENLPVLGKLLKIGTGGVSPFHCEVYYVNKTVQMAVKWGTDSRVRFLEPTYGVPLEIGASGEMNLMVADSRKLLVKLVGPMSGIAWTDRSGFAKSLCDSFRPLISTAVKSNLASCIENHNINIVEIDRNLGLLSHILRESILPGFEEYGITIPEFYVNTVLLPENDRNYMKIKELHTIALQKKMMEAEATIGTAQAEKEKAIKTRIAESDAAILAAQRKAVLEQQQTQTEIARMEAERDLIKAQAEAQAKAMDTRLSGLAEAEVMQAKGYTQKDVLQAEVQEAYAAGIGNMTITGGGGSVAGDMIGLGAGMAVAGAVAPQLGDMLKGMTGASEPQQPAQQENTLICPNCNKPLPENAKFCLECGTKIENLSDNEMICPICGKKTAKGKFCMECGASLVAKCPKCGVELPTGAKFCLECGEKM